MDPTARSDGTMTPHPQVTTIIPTTASAQRADSMRRAVASIRAASAEPVLIRIVVNGSRFDEDLCRWLREQPDVALSFLPQPSLVAAIAAGRRLVDTPFFSFLDDDDEYLPGSLDTRRELLGRDRALDFVVTNGFRHLNGRDAIAFRHFAAATADPLRGVLDAIWLCSCNALYRTDSIDAAHFDTLHARAEWTWLAFALTMDGKRVGVVDAPGFRIHDTPGSLSKSLEYQQAYLALYERMLACKPPPPVARLLRRRVAAAWHDHSVQALGRGERAEALRAHLRSLLLPGGLRFLSYSRRVLRGR